MPDKLRNIEVNDLLLLRRLNYSAVRADLNSVNSLRWVSFRWHNDSTASL